MTSSKRSLAYVAMLLCALFGRADAATDPLSNVNRLPASLEQVVRQVTGELAGNGYEVQRGYWALWGSDQCKYTIRVLGRCFGPNPTAPYAIPFLPSWRDEYVDKTLHNVLGPARRGYSPIFRLANTEALVILAELPPPGSYFGLQTYLFTRQAEIPTEDEIYQGVSQDLREILFATAPNPARLITWATIGDSNNNVVIENQTGIPWASKQQRFFIVTPDQASERDVAEALMAAGVDEDHIFVEKVAADLVNLGLGPAADEFQIFLRYVQVPNTEEGDAWRARLPLTVLRVRYNVASDSSRPVPYPIPDYEMKTANSELDLTIDLQDLIDTVKDRWNQSHAKDIRFAVAELPWTDGGLDTVGQHCLERPMNCLGDNQDDSFRISPNISFDIAQAVPDGTAQGDVVAVVGTLATATENATYVSLALNVFPDAISFGNLTNLNLEGTASAYSTDVANTGKFYLYYFSRDCTGLTPCQEIPESDVPIGAFLKLTERNYVRPGTARAPDASQLLTPSVIVFSRGATP
jgi:hypothetical protein